MTENQELQPQFSIEKVYVKDMSLEIPHAPQIFLERDQPEVEIQLHTGSQQIDEGFFNVLLTVTVTAKLPGDKVAFLVEVTEGGIFQIQHIPEAELAPLLGAVCPNILFPYVREVISSAVTKAGFPPILLAPVNFEALYMQQQAEKSNPGQA